jgi:hypothetical protein
MQIVNSSQSFPVVSGFGPQVSSANVTFPSSVTQATAILSGFLVEFSGNNDHHLGQLDVQVAVPGSGINGATVTVQITYGLRDWSGNWDDQYDGTVFFSVIGE